MSALVLLGLTGGLVLASLGAPGRHMRTWWRARRQTTEDPALIIKPPRRYVDADGRSDFRPELRDATMARRAGGREWS
jgi:hypothetical protein